MTWTEQLAVDWSLKSRVRFKSTKPLPWKHNFKVCKSCLNIFVSVISLLVCFCILCDANWAENRTYCTKLIFISFEDMINVFSFD